MKKEQKLKEMIREIIREEIQFLKEAKEYYKSKKKNEDWFKKGSKKDRELKLKISKLYSKAFKMIANSKEQLKVRKEIEELRNQLSEEIQFLKEAKEYYKSKKKNEDLYYKKVGNKWYESMVNKKGKLKWYVVKFPGDLDMRDMNKLNKSDIPNELSESIINEDDKKKFDKVLSLPAHKGLKSYFDHEVAGSINHKLSILFKIMKDDKVLKRDWAKA